MLKTLLGVAKVLQSDKHDSRTREPHTVRQKGCELPDRQGFVGICPQNPTPKNFKKSHINHPAGLNLSKTMQHLAKQCNNLTKPTKQHLPKKPSNT